MSLSQDEIDALLRGQGETDRKGDAPPQAAGENVQVVLDSYGSLWIDSLIDVFSGSSGKTLSATVQDVGLATFREVQQGVTDDSVVFFVPLREPYKSPLLFVAPMAAMVTISAWLSGAAPRAELTTQDQDVLSPFWDEIANSWQEKLSQRYGLRIESEPTQVMLGRELTAGMVLLLQDVAEPLGYAEFSIQSPSEIRGSFRGYFGKDVIDALDPEQSTTTPTRKPDPAPRPQPQRSEQRTASAQPKAAPPPQAPGPAFQPVVFEPLVADQLHAESPNLNLILDIKMEIRVELGRTQYKVRDILELCPGYVVELNKLAGEPVDLLVNDKLFARGEVVVIDENFGVRVTEILSLKERIETLG